VDLDDVVVEAAGKSIPEIFAEEGESGFRERERLALTMVLQSVKEESTVIALGGGAYVQPEIHEVIRRALIPTVFLDARVDTLLERCQREGKKRPLAQDENHFRQLYEARRSGYMRAEHCVETADKSVAVIVSEIMDRLGWSNEISGVPQSC
jgi:shikimate kinase